MCREVAVTNEQRKLSPSDGEARGTFALGDHCTGHRGGSYLSPPSIRAVLRPVNLPSCGERKRERLRADDGS